MTTLFAFGMPGWQEILLVLVIVLILFGAKRLPELARSLGQSMNEFRKAKDEFDRELHRSAQELEIKEATEKQQHKPS
jgi:sec-independent protein translocase protein TatA